MGSETSKSKKSPAGSATTGVQDVSVSQVLCDANELHDGQMKEVEVEGSKVLVIREDGEYHAIGGKCSHYGAPLVKGALCKGRVRCPWHGACFNIKTGDIEDFPGMDSLPKFDVNVEDDKVKIQTTQQALKVVRRCKDMQANVTDDQQTYLLLGSGGASAQCAETLRQEGFKGKVIIATNESVLPYDRPKLSKALDAKAEAVSLRKPEFYSVYEIDVKTNKEAKSVDSMLKSVSFTDGSSMKYDKLLIATGGIPRTLFGDTPNVHTLRSLADANTIATEAMGKKVVIIGTSFIGLEVAAYLADKAKSVVLVGTSEQPLQAVLGEDIGAMIRKLFEEKGVSFVTGSRPKQFVVTKGKLKQVLLEDGTALDAEICVVGIGVEPATTFLKGSSVTLTDSGFVIVNKRMKTNKAEIYAAGDVTQFPLFMINDSTVNIQHWQMAHQQGRIAGLNMTGHDTEIHSVPFFWTMVFGKSLRYTGYGNGYDEIVIKGNLDEMKFVAYYIKEDRVMAVASLNHDPIVAQAAELFNLEKSLYKHQVSGDDHADWVNELSGTQSHL